jgi:hypothetical protein
MSKRMSLIEAAARKRDEFVKAPAIPEGQSWADEVVEQPSAPAPAVRVMRHTPPPAEVEEAPRKKTTFNIDARLHLKLKLTAVRQAREMVEIVEEALTHHLKTFERAAGE